MKYLPLPFNKPLTGPPTEGVKGARWASRWLAVGVLALVAFCAVLLPDTKLTEAQTVGEMLSNWSEPRQGPAAPTETLWRSPSRRETTRQLQLARHCRRSSTPA